MSVTAVSVVVVALAGGFDVGDRCQRARPEWVDRACSETRIAHPPSGKEREGDRHRVYG